MKISHLYTGDDGQSHFRDIELDMTGGPGGTGRELFTGVQGIAFRDVPDGGSPEFHTAPRRQLIVQLTGSGELICGDGTTRFVGQGDLLIADDRTGQGHRSRQVSGPRSQLVVYLDPDLDLDSLRTPQ